VKSNDPKLELMEHSEAKVSLYGKYLATYLNILSRVSSVDRIFVFDLLCGEGIYNNGAKGSPMIALEVIHNHYYANNLSCPNITVWFNDNGISEIDPSVSKVDRVKSFGDKIGLPPNVAVEYLQEEYDVIYPKAVSLVNDTSYSKGLFFIDPYGYKDIKPQDIREMLSGGNTEVLLWLPISFMYRFADSVRRLNFKGSEPLRGFLTALFGTVQPSFKSVYDFIEQLRGKFRAYLRDIGIFVDTFTLERDASNVYSLFFFTPSVLGFQKMLEAKWSMDQWRGKGYTIDKSPSFFSEIELSGYPQKLLAFINSAEYRTNGELFRFGLENGFLPKHTNEVLRKWKKHDTNFEAVPLDQKPVRGFYVEYGSERRIGFRFRNRA
jgi:three-Cys-motif partner protein